MNKTLHALTSPPEPRPGRMQTAQIAFKLPEEAKEMMEKSAKDQGIPISAVYRHAVADYLRRLGYLR